MLWSVWSYRLIFIFEHAACCLLRCKGCEPFPKSPRSSWRITTQKLQYCKIINTKKYIITNRFQPHTPSSTDPVPFPSLYYVKLYKSAWSRTLLKTSKPQVVEPQPLFHKQKDKTQTFKNCYYLSIRIMNCLHYNFSAFVWAGMGIRSEGRQNSNSAKQNKNVNKYFRYTWNYVIKNFDWPSRCFRLWAIGQIRVFYSEQ